MAASRRPKTQQVADGPVHGRVWLGPAPPITAPHGHAVLAEILTTIFRELEIGASLMDGTTWYPLYVSASSVTWFEAARGVERPRWAYNDQCLARARSEGRVVLGKHAGFSDLFAAIGGSKGCWTLVAGPFATARSTSADILERWQGLAGSQGRVSDHEFLHYLGSTLETTTLEGEALASFKRVLGCLARLLEGSSPASELALEVHALRQKLESVRRVERMWATFQAIVDERTGAYWTSPAKTRDLSLMGLKRPPSQALAGLLLPRKLDADPIDDLVRRDALQRACTEFVRKRGGLLCGRLSQGLGLLLDARGSGPRLATEISEVAERVGALARKFGFELYLGVNAPDDDPAMPFRFQSALGAAEYALSHRQRLVHSQRVPLARAGMLSELRREIALGALNEPKLLMARFERLLQTVCLHCGYRIEPIRAHLEAAFDALLDACRATGAWDEKVLAELRANMERAALRAQTVRDLEGSYHDSVSQIQHALLHPKRLRSDHGLQRALSFVREHASEPISVAKAAKVAGFAPRQFSLLFSKSEGVTFHQYLIKARIERAKQLLESREIKIERVAELAGFPTRSHFHRAFKRSVGIAPLAYRESASWPAAKRDRKN